MIHFIAGLPRAGSTLLAAILRQNPRFEASIQSPLGYSLDALLPSFSAQNEAAVFYDDEKRARMLRALFDEYYGGKGPEVVFDSNRRWCTHAALLKALFPDSKIICMLRPPAHVVDSIERMVQKNPLQMSAIFNSAPTANVYARVKTLMHPAGLVGFAFEAFRELFYGPHKDMMVAIEYADLAQRPAEVMAWLHAQLNEPPFEYDFKNIEPIPGATEFDRSLNSPGLHDLKREVIYSPRNSILPPDIYKNLPPPFWRDVNTSATSSG